MDIRLLEFDDRPQAKLLWKQAFGDSDAFIDWYFTHKILPEHSLGIFDADLVSVVHMIPFTISIQGRPVESAFIAGAATDKSRQGEGLMRILLRESLALMRRRGILMTHLYPFNHRFYEKMGWAAYSYVHKKNDTDMVSDSHADVIETKDARILASLYDKMMDRFDGYVLRGPREWRWRMDEMAADNGRAAVLMKNGSAAAYMLYFESDKKTEVIETVYTDETDLNGLLAFLHGQGRRRVTYTLPSDRRGSKHGMARVVDAQALLTAFGAQPLLEQVDIIDDLAPWNNLRSGGTPIPIGDLAQIIHQGADRFDRYKDSTGSLRGILIPRTACIFESY